MHKKTKVVGKVKEIMLNEVIEDPLRMSIRDQRVMDTNKKNMIGALHKEELPLWVIGILHGRNKGNLVNLIRTGVSNNQLLKNVGQDPQQGHQQYPSQQGAAAQYWPNQPPQSQQQQMPTLPAPVFPPGMQPVGMRPPPGLGPNVQRTRQGVMSQSASIQYRSAASRQQSPYGSQPLQGSAAERQQSPFGQQPPSTGGYFRQGYQ